MILQFKKEDFQDKETTVTVQERDALNHVMLKCFHQSAKQGWHDKPGEVGTKIALIHSEVSEALEGIRKDKMDDHLPHRKAVEVELADAIIRIFDLAGALHLDVGGAIMEKMKYNLHREDHKLSEREKEGGKKF